MGKISPSSSSRSLSGVLEATTSPAYVRTPSSAVVVAVLDVVTGLDEPPEVRVLAPRLSLVTGIEEARRSSGGEVGREEVAFRASCTLVTDTTVVSEERMTQFTLGPEAATELPDAGSGPFVESVYEAHARAWERATPITAEGLIG